METSKDDIIPVNECVPLVFIVRDGKTGRFIEDLVPFRGAAMHLIMTHETWNYATPESL